MGRMMKHNKRKNVGVLFEILNHAVLTAVSNNNISEAKKIFSLLRENFVKSSEISKAYKIYSQFLYSEARNPYIASKFVDNLRREYGKTVKNERLKVELSSLMEELSKITNTKSLMKTPVPNYKTLASFHIKLHEDEQYISSRDRLTIDQNLFDHLIENKEAERVRKQRDKFDNPDIKSLEEIQTSKLSLILAINKFDEAYKHLLTSEQKDYLVKYYTTSNNEEFKDWVCKRVDSLLDEVMDKSMVIQDETIKRKINLVVEKLQGISAQSSVTTSNLKDILLSVEMKDKLKLF